MIWKLSRTIHQRQGIGQRENRKILKALYLKSSGFSEWNPVKIGKSPVFSVLPQSKRGLCWGHRCRLLKTRAEENRESLGGGGT